MPIIITVLFVLLFIGTPIAFSFALAGLLGGSMADIPLGILSSMPYQSVTSFPLMAIPFFILAGEMMNQGKLIDRLIAFADLLLSWLYGRLGYVTILSSAFLGAMTGSSVATVAAVGGSVGEKMVAKGYKRTYVASLIASCGLLGVLIPPSIPLIVYGAAVGASVAELFLATIVPGVVMTTAYCLTHFVLSRKVMDPNSEEASGASQSGTADESKGVIDTLKTSLPALIMPIIILGGIYSGIFTPTEAAAIAGLYCLLFILFSRIISFKKLPSIFFRAAVVSISILSIVAFTSLFNKVLILKMIPQLISGFVIGITDSPVIFLLLVNILLFFVGMFMETNAAVLLMAPLLFPAAKEFGIDPVHFGIVLVTNIEIGLLTPPMAANLYVSSKINKCPVVDMLPYTFLFLGVSLSVLMLITYVPALSLWFRTI